MQLLQYHPTHKEARRRTRPQIPGENWRSTLRPAEESKRAPLYYIRSTVGRSSGSLNLVTRCETDRQKNNTTKNEETTHPPKQPRNTTDKLEEGGETTEKSPTRLVPKLVDVVPKQSHKSFGKSQNAIVCQRTKPPLKNPRCQARHQGYNQANSHKSKPSKQAQTLGQHFCFGLQHSHQCSSLEPKWKTYHSSPTCQLGLKDLQNYPQVTKLDESGSLRGKTFLHH